MSKPLTLAEAMTKRKDIPDFVIDIFNAQLMKNLHWDTAYVYQDDVLALIVQEMFVQGGGEGSPPEHYASTARKKIFDCGWLDVEAMYGAAGWKVTYNKPAYNDSGRSVFIFESP